MRPESDEQKQGVFIVADDLTGALDTAGVFASPGDPMDVFLSLPAGATGHRIGVDLDTRAASDTESAGLVGDAFRRLRGTHPDGIFFKKIDSVLRGNPITETVAAYRDGEFDRVLFAPAFPAMGRITKDAKQHVIEPEGARAVGPPLLEAFEAFGLRAQRLTDAARHAGIDVYIADAASDTDLAQATARFPLDARTLFTGSAGLASVLAGGVSSNIAVPPIELVVCGTNHSAALSQIDALRSRGLPIHDLAGDPTPQANDFKVFAAMDRSLPAADARRRICQSLSALPGRVPPPRAAFVTGGWTLRLLLEASGADHLVCIGQCSVGVPLCRVVGGRWNGVFIVSKSGGFGDPDLLWRLVEESKSAMSARPADAVFDTDASRRLPHAHPCETSS